MARVLKGTSKGVSGTTGKEVVVQVILERRGDRLKFRRSGRRVLEGAPEVLLLAIVWQRGKPLEPQPRGT